MSDLIIPIQTDISGLATFQKIQSYEVQEPPLAATGASVERRSDSGGGGSFDSLNFSAPVRKRLEHKVTTFSAQMPAVAVQRPQLEQAQGPFRKQLDAHENTLADKRRQELPHEGFYQLMEQAQTAYRQRLEQPQSTGNQHGSFNQQSQSQPEAALYPHQRRKQPGLLLNLIR